MARISLFVILFISITRFESNAAAQAPNPEILAPVTIAVIDTDSQKPIQKFDYYFYAQAPGFNAGGGFGKWQSVESADGRIKLDLPASCELTIGVRAAGYIFDTPYTRRYEIKQTDKERRFTHTLRKGDAVRGTVLDATTDRPIAKARVSPTIFRSPQICPDHERSVFTDDKGRFEITGIDTGWGSIILEHDSYLKQSYYLRDYLKNEAAPTDDVVIKLQHGETISGIVRGPKGEPIENAVVDSGDGHRVYTNSEGRFAISGVTKHWGYSDYYVNVRKPGYMEWWKTPKFMPPGGFEVTLEPLFEIRGTVRGADGRPMKSYRVTAGPGRNPAQYEAVGTDVNSRDGSFAVGVDTQMTRLAGVISDGSKIEKEHWLAIKADGHAVWEGWVPFARNAPPLKIQLLRGVGVSGRIVGAGSDFKHGEASLVPERLPAEEYIVTDNAAQSAGTLSTAIGLNGEFRFEHVRPDRYILTVSGSGVTSQRISIQVPDHDLKLEQISVKGMGRIEGQVFNHEGKPWAFANGVLYHKSIGNNVERHFKLDEHGRFTLDDVPAGDVSVGAQYGGGCIVYSDTVNVRVVPGETIHVIVNNPDRSSDARFQFIVGDGSEAQFKSGTGMGGPRLVKNVTSGPPAFRIDLKPLDPGPISLPDMSDWNGLDSQNLVTLPNVPAGRYRLRVFDWLLSRGFDDGLLFEDEIRFDPKGLHTKIVLGGGAVTGQIKVSRKIRRMPQVIAVETSGKSRPHLARCDDAGNFCVRYLSPGTYDLVAHEDANGYRRLPPVKVDSQIVDVGSHDLVVGATIRGMVRLVGRNDPPTGVRAIDSRGASLEALDFKGVNGEQFAISNVWPGDWSIVLERGDEILVTEKAVVSTSDSKAVELVVK